MEMSDRFHIAQLNIARAKYDADDPRFAGFVDNLDKVNAIADRSKGFVWRLQSEVGNAMEVPVTDNPRDLVNISVWETVEDLEHFVFNTVHKKIYDRRREWFPAPAKASFVMWRITPGHIPTVDEALWRLEMLRRNGPSEEAFGWEHFPNLKIWMKKQCA